MDIGWSELLVIGIVALIVVGPKDLPGMFRTLGRYTAKIRRMAREFQRAMEDAADESGMKETAKDLKSLTSPSELGLNKIHEATDNFKKWDPTKPSEKAKSVGPETAKLAEERAERSRQAREKADETIVAAESSEKTPVENPSEAREEGGSSA